MIGHFAGKFELAIRCREKQGYRHSFQGYQTRVEISKFDLCHLQVVLVFSRSRARDRILMKLRAIPLGTSFVVTPRQRSPLEFVSGVGAAA